MENNHVIGFHYSMNYSCKDCKSLCCKNEYEMPIFNFEEQLYLEKYPSVAPFIVLSENKSINTILRANSCFFLNQMGLCIIHEGLGKSLKPLICQIYPYMFIKYPKFVFIYKYPCKNMKWVDFNKKLLEKEEIAELSTKINKFYKKIFSDQIDQYNPYMFIKSSRIIKTKKILDELELLNWNFNLFFQKNNNLFINNKLINLEKFIKDEINKDSRNSELINKFWDKYKISLFVWLNYNPFILALEIEIAIIISVLAILWGKELFYTQINTEQIQDLYTKIDDNFEYKFSDIAENVSWNTVKIVTHKWWINLFYYIDKIFPKKWEQIRIDISYLINENLLPFPEDGA